MSLLPKENDWIRYTTKTARTGRLVTEQRVGQVRCIWGNGWDGAHIDTSTGCCIPSLGDTFEIVAPPEDH